MPQEDKAVFLHSHQDLHQSTLPYQKLLMNGLIDKNDEVFCEGKIDVVIQCQNKIWDVHALIPIIAAAGGIGSTWKNKDAKLAGNILFSANRNIHKKMLKLLNAVTEMI